MTKQRDSEQRHDWRENQAAQEALQASIEAVLDELYTNNHEVPFIATYRKEVIMQQLAS